MTASNDKGGADGVTAEMAMQVVLGFVGSPRNARDVLAVLKQCGYEVVATSDPASHERRLMAAKAAAWDAREAHDAIEPCRCQNIRHNDGCERPQRFKDAAHARFALRDAVKAIESETVGGKP